MSGNATSSEKPGPLVLVVDEDSSALGHIRSLLERNGYMVETAASGEEALQVLGKTVPDVLILEVSLPGISGLDLCQIAKRDKRLGKVKVVFLTREGSATIYKLGHDAGADIFMTKPVSSENLLRTLRLITPPPRA